MIRASYDRKELCLSVKGHAASAPKGQDLVCAAASTLAFTLAAAVLDSAERYAPIVSRQEGEIRIACRPARGERALCRRAMDTVFTGFEMLANEYPDYVKAKRED